MRRILPIALPAIAFALAWFVFALRHGSASPRSIVGNGILAVVVTVVVVVAGTRMNRGPWI